jgi:anti-sigma-K factor RskA
VNYRRPELLDTLAAHYVHGALRGRARRRFERLIAADAGIAGAVGRWEARFAPIALGLDPVAPPPSVRAALVGETLKSKIVPLPVRPLRALAPVIEPRPKPEPGPLPAAPPFAAPARSRRGRRLRFLAAASGCGVLIVGGLIALAGGRLSFPAGTPAEAPLAAASDEAQPLPMLVARVGMPASSMGWMISLSPDHRQLQITASDDYLSAGRASVQLWWLAADGQPRPLAVLGTERDSTVVVDVPPGFTDAHQALVFAITLEPPGGSPTGQPTRPVLSTAVTPSDI